MNRSTKALIDQLAEDLTPVRPMRQRGGRALVALAGAATLAAVWLVAGFWPGPVAGGAQPFFFVTNGLLLLVAMAASGAAVALANPAVGNRHDAPAWTAAMLAILPLTAVVIAIVGGHGPARLVDSHSIACLTSAAAASALTFVALAYWLKRGAPVSIGSAGLYAGMAAGATGSFAYGLSCPIDTVAHLGIWHVLPVALCAALGRAILPRLVRW